MDRTKTSPGLRRALSIALTVLFLGFIYVALGAMLIGSSKDIHKGVQMTPAMQKTLPEHANALDKLAARINGFTSAISDVMWLKTEMGYVNSAFQYGLGKRLINTGSQNMITLTTGHLYDVSPYRSLQPGVDRILEQVDGVLADLPFLFVYEHPTLYDDAMMPAEYAALDDSGRMADEAVGALRAHGVRVLDSRDVLPGCGYALDDLLMVTDQHWSTLAAIVMGQAIAGELNDMTGAELDPSLLDLSRLNTLVHERLFLGKYGQRVGTAFVTPDDIVEYWPKYDTEIHRTTRRGRKIEEASGPFREAVTRAETLIPENDEGWSCRAYLDYGLTEPYSIFENPNAPDRTILLLKDSYAAPIGTFMSLLARHVVCVDLRQDVGPLEDWIAQYRPDAVVMAYSLQMLRDDNYAFDG